MPAVTNGPPQRNEQMWQALKRHIIRERQRKKEAQEADAAIERRRQEIERRKQQDDMTLGETREQLSTLEKELSQLKDEKHQLFLQLKKVLNEDDNRRRQLIKDNSAMSEVLTAVGGYPGMGNNVIHPQVFVPMPNRGIYKVTTAQPTHTLLQGGPMKRSHSPSPPPPATSYHVNYNYKPPPTITYSQPQIKTEDPTRRSNDSRATLWNKNNAPAYPPSTFYSTPSGQSVYSYSTPTTQQSREPEPSKVYLSGNRTSLPTHQSAYLTNMHSLDHKGPYAEDKFYMRPSSHVTVHGGAIPIQPAQGAKTGGITSGYPVRAPQPPPGSYPPPGTYVSGSSPSNPARLIYSQPPRYMQRES